MLNEETLKTRRTGIGGSDAAQVLGLSRWGGAFTVWDNKVNGVDKQLDSEAIHWGNVLEDVVAQEFMRRTGLEVVPQDKTFRSEKYPFMIANIDRQVVGENQGLECKTASAFKASEWSGDELPDEYYIQVQHYCSVMDWEGCWIACLIGGQKFIHKFVPRNEAFIKDMRESEGDFWNNYVLTKTPPEISEADKVIIAQKSEKLLTPVEGDFDAAIRLVKINAEIKQLEAHKKLLENTLKLRIGENAGIEGIATYKKIKDSVKTDWEALCEGEKISSETIAKYSRIQEGYRRFCLKFKECAD